MCAVISLQGLLLAGSSPKESGNAFLKAPALKVYCKSRTRGPTPFQALSPVEQGDASPNKPIANTY